MRAAAQAVRLRHGAGVCAVLFYGSCLRDGYAANRIVDLYVLVDDYASVHPYIARRWLSRLVPPDVYQLATADRTDTVRIKYALVSLPHLERRVRSHVRNPYFWVRLAQPVALVWARGPDVRARVRGVAARAVRTTYEAARPLTGQGADALDVWTRAFAETYRTELRAELPGRAQALVEHDPQRYRRLAMVMPHGEPDPTATAGAAARRWHRRRLEGKALSILRLAKASFTFADGLDYVAWKIEQHSGILLTPTPWQRRHPLLAAPLLLWRLVRRGGVR